VEISLRRSASATSNLRFTFPAYADTKLYRLTAEAPASERFGQDRYPNPHSSMGLPRKPLETAAAAFFTDHIIYLFQFTQYSVFTLKGENRYVLRISGTLN